MEIQAVRGMHDLFGSELRKWHFLEEKLRSIFHAFGYEEIRTPVLEKIEVFKGTVGDESDIVEKQMYVIEKESETLVLRPEGTAGFIRAVLEHQLHATGAPARYYYYLPMYRHERPQKGRLRQFHQFGAEIINDGSPEADAEIITLLDQVYKSFGISEFTAKINSVGCNQCRPTYKEVLKAFFKPQLAALCATCQTRFDRAPMRILDCKRDTCKAIAKQAPKITDSLCSECNKHHTSLQTRLKEASVNFENDPSIVRGLDYYNRTAFEFTSSLLGAQDALGGGGRYDGISERFGQKPFPAVGFGLGMERLFLALEAKGLLKEKKEPPVFYLAALGQAAFNSLYPVGMQLRRRGIQIETSYDPEKALKWHLKQANRAEARFTVIIGEDEMKSSKAVLKDMSKGTQEMLPLNELLEKLLEVSTRAS